MGEDLKTRLLYLTRFSQFSEADLLTFKQAAARIALLEEALQEIAGSRDQESPSEYNRGWNASRYRLREIARAALSGEEE